MKKILLLFLIGLLAYACAKVPLTGRSQLAMVSNEEIMPLVEAEYQKFKSEAKLVTNTPNGQQVVRVGQRISQAVEKFLIQEGYEDLVKSFSWEFNLEEGKEVNAWCMPGGKVAFYTGIMPICQDENGIAVVMGHEVAHAVASHARERMSNGLAANFGLSLLSAAMGQNPTLTQQIFLQSVGIGSELGMLKFSRKHELEAEDRKSTRLNSSHRI